MAFVDDSANSTPSQSVGCHVLSGFVDKSPSQSNVGAGGPHCRGFSNFTDFEPKSAPWNEAPAVNFAPEKLASPLKRNGSLPARLLPRRICGLSPPLLDEGGVQRAEMVVTVIVATRPPPVAAGAMEDTDTVTPRAAEPVPNVDTPSPCGR